MTPARSGAALIIALVILAALMLLGLPFLISQSSGLSGTRNFAHAQTATVGQSTAENAGIGAAASAFSMHLVSGAERGQAHTPIVNLPDQDWSRLSLDLGGATRAPQLAYAGGVDNRLGLDLRSWPLGFTATNSAILGTYLEDESGKLDANALDAVGWSILLAANNISDWDDGDAAADDHDSLGQLAQALATARFDSAVLGHTPTLGADQRITDLNQLLRALPQGAQHRPGLTKSELERLRPHLTLHVPAQARGGLIDLGTVIAADPSGTPVLDSIAPAQALAFPLGPNLVGAGTVLASGDDGLRGRLDNRDFASVTPGNGHRPLAGERVAIEAQPEVNIHQATAPVLTVLNAVAPGVMGPTLNPATIGALRGHGQGTPDGLRRPLTGIDSLDPVSSYRELGHAALEQSQLSDPGVNGSALLDSDGATPLFVGGAQYIHAANGPFPNLPRSGWARIDGHEAGTLVQVAEYIFYASSSLPTGATSATLYQVSRARSPSPGLVTLARSFRIDADAKITFLEAQELQPLAIASHGVVTIESAATVTGPQGRPDAQRARRVVVQALPQENQLEVRWTTQAQLRALLAGRNGSLMATFPLADTRLRNYPPQDVPDAGTLDIDQSTGMRPAVLSTLATTSFTNWSPSWSVTFSGSTITAAPPNTVPDYFLGSHTAGSPLSLGLPLAPAPSPTLDLRLNPEGFELDGIQNLIYAQPGFWAVIGGSSPSLDSENFAFWFKPNATPNADFTLFDLRIPLANAGLALQSTAVGGAASAFDARAASGDNALQNHVTLRYDSLHRQLVLRVTPPAIEHPTDYGPNVGLNDPALTVDGQTTVVAADPPLAPLQPDMAIEQRYQLGSAMLDPSTWHLVQGTIAGNAPGMMALVVDGVVGRDVSALVPLPSTLTVGDQFPVPCLQLVDSLIAPSVATSRAAALAAARTLGGPREIHLLGLRPDPLGSGVLSGPAAVAGMLPTRGMIRVGDEYISYLGVDATGKLSNILRARRQDTVADGDASNPRSWPVLQAHRAGDRVVPGGFRLNEQSACRLFHGGCLLAAQQFRDHPLLTSVNVDPALSIAATDLAVPVTDHAGWPTRGFVKAVATSEIMYYESIDTLDRLIIPPPAGALHSGRAQFGTLASSIGGGTELVQISFEVDKPIGTDWYQSSAAPPGVITEYYLQLYHQDIGSVEWIRYTDTINVNQLGGTDPTTIGYFVDRNTGFAKRAQQRTSQRPGAEFPIGTRVIPVQDSLGNAVVLATGDILTLMPRTPSPSHPPRQVCVRYVPCDGFPAAGTPTLDENNYMFAFTDALPGGETWQCVSGNDPNGFDLLAWPCWNGRYIGQIQAFSSADLPASQLPSHLPYHVGFAASATAPLDNAHVVFGAADTVRLASGSPSEPFAGRIDGLASGPQQGAGTVTGITAPAFDPAGSLPWLTAADSVPTTFSVQTIGTSFGNTGLVLIGGEVFAYQGDQTAPIPISSQATLVGRGLLGSPHLDHHLNEPVLVLPLGPVAILGSMSTAAAGGPISFIGLQPNAPALLMCDANSGAFEAIAAPNGVTAPWLRGLYGTPIASSWPAGSIAIGWWPRYPSPLSRTDSTQLLPGGTLPEAFRCRTYSWASFPIRFHDTYFPPQPATLGALFDEELLENPLTIDPTATGPGTTPEFSIFAAALPGPGQDDWTSASFFELTPGGMDPFINAPFRTGAGANLHALPVDGAEVRITWTYPPTSVTVPATTVLKLLASGLRANHAPIFGRTHLRAQASSKILAVLPP